MFSDKRYAISHLYVQALKDNELTLDQKKAWLEITKTASLLYSYIDFMITGFNNLKLSLN